MNFRFLYNSPRSFSDGLSIVSDVPLRTAQQAAALQYQLRLWLVVICCKRVPFNGRGSSFNFLSRRIGSPASTRKRQPRRESTMDEAVEYTLLMTL